MNLVSFPLRKWRAAPIMVSILKNNTCNETRIYKNIFRSHRCKTFWNYLGLVSCNVSQHKERQCYAMTGVIHTIEAWTVTYYPHHLNYCMICCWSPPCNQLEDLGINRWFKSLAPSCGCGMKVAITKDIMIVFWEVKS